MGTNTMCRVIWGHRIYCLPILESTSELYIAIYRRQHKFKFALMKSFFSNFRKHIEILLSTVDSTFQLRGYTFRQRYNIYCRCCSILMQQPTILECLQILFGPTAAKHIFHVGLCFNDVYFTVLSTRNESQIPINETFQLISCHLSKCSYPKLVGLSFNYLLVIKTSLTSTKLNPIWQDIFQRASITMVIDMQKQLSMLSQTSNVIRSIIAPRLPI